MPAANTKLSLLMKPNVHPVIFIPVGQWIDLKPAKFQIQVRFLAGIPSYGDCSVKETPQFVKLILGYRNSSVTPKFAPVVQWPEHIFGKDETGVQFTTGAPAS